MEKKTTQHYLFPELDSPVLLQMKEYAKEHFIPIMDERSLHMLLTLLTVQQPKRILELGSAIGYSAIRMALALPNAHITTIERDDVRYEEAVQNIHDAELNERIAIHHADALEWDTTKLHKTFDALFIDAAKGQYERFFEKYEPYVQVGGIIYCDNIAMDGQVLHPLSDIPRRNRTMIRNLQQFIETMYNHPRYEVSYLNIGDGLLIARKVKEDEA